MTPDEQEELGWQIRDIIWQQERDKWPEDEWAYDGSAWPQRRELSPRDRDILTRILSGWWHRLIEMDHERRGLPGRVDYLTREIMITQEMLDDPSVSWMRMSVDECKRLMDMRIALETRQD
jgi:hypothetical protein